jgi:hypothetical protein
MSSGVPFPPRATGPAPEDGPGPKSPAGNGARMKTDNGQTSKKPRRAEGDRVLTDRDIDSLTDAIRAATAPEPPRLRDKVRYGLQIVFLFGLLALFLIPFRLHQPVPGSYSGAVNGKVGLNLNGATWSVPGVYARTMTVVEHAASQPESVVLPVAPTQCARLAKALHASCKEGELVTSPAPLVVSWSRPEEEYLASPLHQPSPAEASGLYVQISQPATPNAQPCTGARLRTGMAGTCVSISASNTQPTSWCSGRISTGTTLKLWSGPYHVSVLGPLSAPCAEGLQVAVQPFDLQTTNHDAGKPFHPARPLPTAIFGGVASLSLQATSDRVSLQDLKDLQGTLDMAGSNEKITYKGSALLVGDNGVQVNVSSNGTKSQVAMSSNELASADFGSNRVPNLWHENFNFWFTAFLTVSLGVLGIFFALHLPNGRRPVTERGRRKATAP